jgi:hypothetical protein
VEEEDARIGLLFKQNIERQWRSNEEKPNFLSEKTRWKDRVGIVVGGRNNNEEEWNSEEVENTK